MRLTLPKCVALVKKFEYSPPMPCRILIAASLMALLCAPTLTSNPRTYQGVRIGPGGALLQARSCIGELGWGPQPPADPDLGALEFYYFELDQYLNACEALVGIHTRRAALGSETISSLTERYSMPVKPLDRRAPHHRGVRPWTLEIRPTGPAPASWPARYPWRPRQQRLRLVLEHIEALFAEDRPDVCAASAPMHHGGPMDGPHSDDASDYWGAFERDWDCTFYGQRQRIWKPRQ